MNFNASFRNLNLKKKTINLHIKSEKKELKFPVE